MLKPGYHSILCFLILISYSDLYGQVQEKDTGRSASSINPELEAPEGFNYLAAPHKKSKKKGFFHWLPFISGSKKKKRYKGSFEWQLDQKVKEYEKRMKRAARRLKKEARLAQKPQYSDPLYFGHKRKPKKRKPGKRKLCKECLIVH